MDKVLQDILEAVEDAPQASDVEKTNTRSIQRVVRQCYALLSQEMERKVKLEPDLYSRDGAVSSGSARSWASSRPRCRTSRTQ